MSFLTYLLEMEGEHLPKDNSVTARLASEIVDAAGGDPQIARKMANNFVEQLLKAVDEKSNDAGMRNFSGRPVRDYPNNPPASGYEPESGPKTTGFSRRA